MNPESLPQHFANATAKALRAGRHAAMAAWAKNTLPGYSSGLTKFIEFKE